MTELRMVEEKEKDKKAIQNVLEISVIMLFPVNLSISKYFALRLNIK